MCREAAKPCGLAGWDDVLTYVVSGEGEILINQYFQD